MSKFRIIEGSNVTSIVDTDREVKILEIEANKKIDPQNKELVVYAYHFLRLGRPILAQKQLNRVTSGYFDMMIYKDLFQAMLAWSLIQNGNKSDELHKQYEFFIIVKRSLDLFDTVNFNEKYAFYRFRREFERYNHTLSKI